jgi:hypothetical protein
MLAADSHGYAVGTTTTANADGSTTIANVASNADGSLAYERVLNTSADGLSKTLTILSNGGVASRCKRMIAVSCRARVADT